MTASDTLLGTHIALGTAGLILGPVAMTARKRPRLHTKAGEAHHWVMLGVCVSATHHTSRLSLPSGDKCISMEGYREAVVPIRYEESMV
jgi:uncharacterized membrane protein